MPLVALIVFAIVMAHVWVARAIWRRLAPDRRGLMLLGMFGLLGVAVCYREKSREPVAPASDAAQALSSPVADAGSPRVDTLAPPAVRTSKAGKRVRVKMSRVRASSLRAAQQDGGNAAPATLSRSALVDLILLQDAGVAPRARR